jgi:hypothetical protein
MYTSTFRALARATSITPVQKRTLCFCGPKIGSGSHTSPLPQHYLAGPMAERGVQVTKTSTKDAKTSMKDPATSATVAVTEDSRKLEEELEKLKPITTAWAHGVGEKKAREGEE